MAKSKQVKEQPQPKEQAQAQAEVKASVGVTPQSIYRPLPRFNSGCKNC